MRRTLRWTILGGLLAGATALLIITAMHRARERRSRELAGWPVEAAATYSLQSRSEIVSAGNQMMSMVVAGTLDFQPVPSPNATGRLLGVTFSGGLKSLQGALLGPGGSAVQSSLEEALARPFVLEYSSGRFVGVRFSEGIPMLAKQIWKSLAETLQLSPPGRGEKRWLAEEQDSTGTYQVSYESSGSAGAFVKHKVRYTHANDEAVSVEVLESRGQIQLGAGGSLQSLQLAERIRVTTGTLPPMTAQLNLRLERSEGGAPAPAARDYSAVAATRPLRVSEPLERDPEVQRQLDQARIGGARFEDLLPKLLAGRQANGSAEDKEAGQRAYVALAALLRTDPSKLPQVRQHIIENGELSEVLINALRDAGTPEAQEILAELAHRQELEYARRAQSLRGLSLVANPTEASTDELKSFENDERLRVQATYGLGSNVYRLREHEPERAQQTLNYIIARLAAAQDEDARVRYLVALGNSGHPGALPTLASSLKDASPRIRAAATEALRRIDGEQAEALLIEAIKDPAVEVRFAAVDAIFERKMSAVFEPIVGQLVLSEPDYRTRARAVQTVGAWWQQKPGTLRESLALVATQDDHEDLRQLARTILETKPSGATANP